MKSHRNLTLFLLIVSALAVLLLAACQPAQTTPSNPTATVEAEADPEPQADPEPFSSPEPEVEATVDLNGAALVVYSGRNENLVGPLIEEFEEETGIDVAVRYGETAEMAATILEEGQNSPADLFFAQDAGALGALSAAGRLTLLPDDVLNQVEARFRAENGEWVGTSGRARVVVYNTAAVSEDQLPNDIWGYADPAWKGKIGWAPTNGSFQSFITALRLTEGDERAREWLEAMIANDVKSYPNNNTIVEAVSRGEIDAGFVNHYYLMRYLAEQGESFPARNHFLTGGDAGAMINVAGVGILDTASHSEAAEALVRFLLSPEAQTYFADETDEYPLIAGVAINPNLTPLADLNAPDIDLSNLQDLQGTLDLLQDTGALD